MRQLIEAIESSDVPANDSRTSEESQNEKTRQGETPKVQPNGAALPP